VLYELSRFTSILDTNLLVSYLLTHRPPIATLIDEYLAREHLILLTGATLLEELDRVLRYPRLQRYYTEEARTRFVALIAALSEVVELPDSVPRICRDPDDDWVITCAVAGQADVIVSGDRDLLALEQVGKIPILSAAQFLTCLEERGPGMPDQRLSFA
jgi:putative PIN family toxin of toxin-antitoxin system